MRNPDKTDLLLQVMVNELLVLTTTRVVLGLLRTFFSGAFRLFLQSHRRTSCKYRVNGGHTVAKFTGSHGPIHASGLRTLGRCSTASSAEDRR